MPREPRSLWWYLVIIPFGIIAVAGIPVWCVLISSAVANAYGCRLDEANAHTCAVAGTDIGGTLAYMFVMGWFGMLTLPVGALALMAWAVVVAVTLVRRNR